MRLVAFERLKARTRAYSAAKRRALFGIGFVVVAFVAHLARQQGQRSWDTVWAEDGLVYASDAFSLPAWSTLLKPYAGYAQFVPRLLALAVRVLPVSMNAAYFAVSSSLIWAVLALFVYRHMHCWVESTGLRLLLCAMFVVGPSAGFEVSANIANLGWPLLFASFWAVVSLRQSPLDVVSRVVVVMLSALTSPLTGLLLPWLVVRVIKHRRGADIAAIVAMVVALGVQAVPVMTAPTSSVSVGANARYLPIEYGLRVLGSAVVGERWLPSVWEHVGVVAVFAAIAVIVGVVASTRPWTIESPRVWFAFGSIAMSVLLFAVPVWNRDAIGLRPDPDGLGSVGSRYVVVPALLLFCAVIVLIDASSRPWLRRIVVAHGAVLILASYTLTNPRSVGPVWSTEVSTYEQICQSAPPDANVSVPITPADQVWVEVVPCKRAVR